VSHIVLDVFEQRLDVLAGRRRPLRLLHSSRPFHIPERHHS
jgi:hypothetical protein